MSFSLHQPHDAFFRKAMSDLRVATEFFQQHLPKSLQTQIDWRSLNLKNASFLDENLKRSAADVVYQVKLLDGKSLYLYLLCEHTSEPDPRLAFRIIKYIVRIIDQHSEQHPDDPFPAVYPLVLYTGNKPYKEVLDWYALFGEQSDFMRAVFHNPVQLIEVCKIEDPELRHYLWAGAFEFLLKHRFKQELNQAITQQLGEWLKELEGQDGFELTCIMLNYLLNFFDINRGKQFIAALKPYLTSRLEKEAMTIGEQLRFEGLQQGLQEGRQQGLRQGKQQGLEQGLKQGKRDEALRIAAIARTMRSKGFGLDIIKEITGLAEQDIVEITV